MRITDEVAVPADPAAVFAALADVGRALPCLPGAWVEGRQGGVVEGGLVEEGLVEGGVVEEGVVGGVHTGGLRVRVGPVTPVYRGTVRVLTADRDGRRLVLDARGRDDEGNGAAGAHLDLRVVPGGDGTARLRLDADLVVRGRVARGGRGVLAGVAHDLAVRFADELATLATARPIEPHEPPEPPLSEVRGRSPELRSQRQVLGIVAGALGIGALVAAAVVVRRGRAR